MDKTFLVLIGLHRLEKLGEIVVGRCVKHHGNVRIIDPVSRHDPGLVGQVARRIAHGEVDHHLIASVLDRVKLFSGGLAGGSQVGGHGLKTVNVG